MRIETNKIEYTKTSDYRQCFCECHFYNKSNQRFEWTDRTHRFFKNGQYDYNLLADAFYYAVETYGYYYGEVVPMQTALRSNDSIAKTLVTFMADEWNNLATHMNSITNPEFKNQFYHTLECISAIGFRLNQNATINWGQSQINLSAMGIAPRS